MAGMNAVIRTTDMNKQMLQDAVDCAAHALTKFKEQKGIAQFIKKEFDTKYSVKWHVVVGREFGSYVTHEVKDFAYFFIDELGFLLWRTHPQDNIVAVVEGKAVREAQDRGG
eukprot:TRINITY_DN19038_c0_g1_i1.p1 TRINITY_DN19038_c0_g1~~TRINITY_DN19038_c0_g1_i1.p1  ORF type:complete len:112 (+),score=25.27 TRINITY_DN19038_c0_g1_i1:69-404(+)